MIYSPSPLQTPWGHFSFIVLSIFVKIPVFPGCHSNFLKSHFVFPKSHLAFQRVLVFKFSSYNVWKHVRYRIFFFIYLPVPDCCMQKCHIFIFYLLLEELLLNLVPAQLAWALEYTNYKCVKILSAIKQGSWIWY